MKRCSRCKVEKTPDGFSSDRGKRDGLSGHCRSCAAERSREWYANNRGQAKSTGAAYYRAHRASLIEKAAGWAKSNRDRINALSRKSRRDNPKPPTEAARRWREAHRPEIAALSRAYAAAHPERAEAYKAVRKALRAGHLTRQPCEVCGFHKTHAHHDSYDPQDRLKVRWLCLTHHAAHHREERDARRADLRLRPD